MELLFSTIISAAIGALLYYLLPGRERSGTLLLPGIAAAVGAAVWVGLVWLGWKFDGGWIWVVTFVAAGLVSLIVGLRLPRARNRYDEQLFEQLVSRGTV